MAADEAGEVIDREYEFDGRTFARAWLTVASAASEDTERFMLYRSVNVELDDDGVRLTSTDSYRFWSWWVGEYAKAAEPDFEEEPGAAITLADGDFRCRDLMRWVMRRTKKETDPRLTVALRVGRAPTQDGQFPGTEPRAVTFEVSSAAGGLLHESLVLTAVEGEYPGLRAVYFGRQPAPAGAVAFNPVLLTKMAKAVAGSEEEYCTFELSGPNRLVIVRPWAAEGTWPLRGALMPVTIREPDAEA